MKKQCFLISILFFTLLFSYSQEVSIEFENKPQGDVGISATSEGLVFADNFLPTTSYQGGNIVTSFNIATFDFYTSPNYSEIVFGYGKYKIEIDGNYVFVDLRDCNYPYLDRNDLEIIYDFQSGQFKYNGYDVTGNIVGIWLIWLIESHK